MYNNKNRKTLEELHPFTKGAIAMFMILAIFLFQYHLIYIPCGIVLLMISIRVKDAKGYFKKIVITNLIMFLPMFIMQVLFKPGETPVFSWFIINITEESITYALDMFLRLSVFSSIILLFFHITTLKEFVTSLEESGVPKSIGFMLMSTSMLVPEIIKNFNNIMDAQRVRGIEITGGLLVRMRAFLPMLIPLIMSSILATEERALTLEARGFTSGINKVYLHPMKKTKADIIIMKIFNLGSIALILGKLVITWVI